MPDIQTTESERKSQQGKWFIGVGLIGVLIALLVRPMIHCPNKSAAQIVNPIASPPVTASVPWPQVTAPICSPQVKSLPPADADESENTASNQVVDSGSNQLAESQETAQLRALAIELADLDSYVAEERQGIETWYAGGLAQLKAWAENRVKKLDGEEKAAWAWCLRQIQNTRTYTEGRMTARSYGQARGYISQSGYVVRSGYVQTEGRITQGRGRRVAGDPAGDYRKFLIGIQNSRDAVEREFVRLREMRNRYLAELEAFGNRKKATIEARRLYLKRDAQRRTQGGPGLLDGIFASGGGYGAMIDGEVVHEGSSINGYRVRRITRDSVQFETSGQVLSLTVP